MAAFWQILAGFQNGFPLVWEMNRITFLEVNFDVKFIVPTTCTSKNNNMPPNLFLVNKNM